MVVQDCTYKRAMAKVAVIIPIQGLIDEQPVLLVCQSMLCGSKGTYVSLITRQLMMQLTVICLLSVCLTYTHKEAAGWMYRAFILSGSWIVFAV